MVKSYPTSKYPAFLGGFACYSHLARWLPLQNDLNHFDYKGKPCSYGRPLRGVLESSGTQAPVLNLCFHSFLHFYEDGPLLEVWSIYWVLSIHLQRLLWRKSSFPLLPSFVETAFSPWSVGGQSHSQPGLYLLGAHGSLGLGSCVWLKFRRRELLRMQVLHFCYGEQILTPAAPPVPFSETPGPLFLICSTGH